MKEWLRVFRAGLSIDNPLTVLMIGLCATLAVSSQVEGSLFMGIAVIFVLVMSNALISVLRKLIPSQVRIPIFIVIIASFVTVVDLFLKAFFPPIYAVLGIWIPLIVVNCIILGRAEAFAYHNKVWLSVADGLGMGVGFSLVLVGLAFIREFFGAGKIELLGATILKMPTGYAPPTILMMFPGAFILFGFVVAFVRWLNERSTDRKVA
ncbi:MAG: electron transport complex subunit RsxE [Actinobacteria bacterium HGW-Actinobacteria-1]|jgi:electron transport complex protein RnfE|nr:MAG: electron transport complex subunit RsxE [Actinobacteria bacterium HGW-Actinobacteria-1]